MKLFLIETTFLLIEDRIQLVIKKLEHLNSRKVFSKLTLAIRDHVHLNLVLMIQIKVNYCYIRTEVITPLYVYREIIKSSI